MDVLNHTLSLLRVEDDRPFFKSSGVINFYTNIILRKISKKIDTLSLGRNFNLSPQERLIPFDRVAIINEVLKEELPLDLIFYDDDTLAILPPSHKYSKRNWVFFHGIRGNPGQYLLNDNIDLLITNSYYFAEVLKSIMLSNLNNVEKLSVNLKKISPTVLPVPLLDYPNGYDSQGADVPEEVKRLLKSDFVIATSIQRDKPIPEALIYIGKILSKYLIEKNKYLKIIVSDKMKDELTLTNYNLGGIFSNLDDIFLFVPVLKNKCLVEIMKKSSFTLCYFRYPESFGLYPLESVLLRKPVYTNGIGNNRFLLPENHGIFHIENIEMYKYKSENSYLEVSKKIFEDIFNSNTKEKCDKGVQFINSHYNSKVYEQSLVELAKKKYNLPLDGLSNKGRLVISISPLVRMISYEQMYIVTDYIDRTITEDEINFMKKVRSKHIKASELCSFERDIYSTLSTQGILTQKLDYEI